jgi:prepilin signal peptidase PulO-like enzyme (type II secretory pathway)
MVVVFYLIKDNDVPMVRASVMVLNSTLNNISVISWQPFLFVDETNIPLTTNSIIFSEFLIMNKFNFDHQHVF